MGCENSKSIGVNNISQNPGEKRKFTDAEIGLILKTWRRHLHNDMVGNGSKVFIKIFDLAPFVKELFGFRSLKKEAMVMHPRFRLHAGRFMQAIGAAVENVHSAQMDKDVAPILQTLGNRHNVFDGFDIDYIDVFHKALLEVWEEVLGSEFTPECERAWTKIFAYVTEQFRNGFLFSST